MKNNDSESFNNDILDIDFLKSIKTDIVYLDPPYNNRQYSKNYFPLNIIAKSPKEQNNVILTGKTGIPNNCFISSFCKTKTVENAFHTLFKNLNTQWIFLSYNSESLINKDEMIKIMEKYGKVSIEERDYKRFKSFEYNENKEIKEYLFCIQKY